MTTEDTEYTELIQGLFSVCSECSVVCFFVPCHVGVLQ